VVAGITGAAVPTMVQTAIGAAVPYLMSATGVVVQGVGTVHAAGSATAIAQTIAMTTVGPVAVVGCGAVAVGGYLYSQTEQSETEQSETESDKLESE